jgi:hypothetical protein
MEREPDRRFQNTEEMRAAISGLLASTPDLDAHALPKRFLAPSSDYGSDDDDQTDALSRRSSVPTLEGPATTIMPRGEFPSDTLRLPQHRPLRWIAVGGSVLTAALLTGFALLGGDSSAGARSATTELAKAPLGASASAAPQVAELNSDVVVELYGVPANATVRVDGESHAGSTLHFARNSGEHEIVVEAQGREPFRVLHDARDGGRYAIALEESKVAKPARAPLAGKPTNKLRGGLVRQPDF